MARFWICHWLFRNWRPDAQREGKPLRSSSSNSFRERGVSVGDSVYIVSLGAGQLYLGGRMIVKRIVTRAEAVRLWNNDDLYDSEEWVVDPDESGTLLHLHRRLSPALTKQLRFLSKTGPREPFFVSETELSSQATRGLPELAPESAALLDRIIDVTDQLPRTGLLLTVTEQMLGEGGSAAGRDESHLPVETPRVPPHFSSAFELLKPGEAGLFIYTDGLNMKIHEDGTGESGWWLLNPERPFDRAFIFKRFAASQGPHEIFSGRCTGFEGPDDGNRWKLLLADVRLEGKTLTNWKEFAETSQNPIRFLVRPMLIPERIMSPDPLHDLDAGRQGEGSSMTPERILESFAQLQYRSDVRRHPDERRRGQFRAGWEDATRRGRRCRAETLEVLTWHNLGFRLGERFGDQSPEQIKGAFDLLASLYTHVDSGLETFEEGRVKFYIHRRKERNRAAVRRKIEVTLARRGSLRCEVCDFDFAQVYGELGNGFAECHHTLPVATLGEGHRTRLSELAVVCANCHRMLHKRLMLTVDQLREIVLRQRGDSA